MRIVFDFEAVLKNRYSGFYTFGTGLLGGFGQLDDKPELVLLCSEKFASDARKLAQSFTIPATVKPVMMPPTKSAPRILTVHDLRRYVLPELYKKSKLARFENAVQRADHFMAVSESTKSDLCNIFGIAPEKVSVVHLAYDGKPAHYDDEHKQQIREQLQAQYKVKLGRYLLAFSSPDHRKNITRIIKAFQIAKSAIDKDIKLVVIGKPPKNESLPTGPDIIMAGAVEDVRPWLIGCGGLVFASLYEGFGLPILEAFASGVPVITSDCSSMPEVAGDAAILVSPGNTDSIAAGITTLCNDPESAGPLVNLGYQRLNDFAWRRTAEKTMELYQRLI
jgi:alpha-1,3-rhamnosyl/mannosyltransferase